MTQKSAVLGDFLMLLREAHEATEAVDAFDLRSADPASQAAFDSLVAQEVESVRTLIQYVQANGPVILDCLVDLGSAPGQC